MPFGIAECEAARKASDLCGVNHLFVRLVAVVLSVRVSRVTPVEATSLAVVLEINYAAVVAQILRDQLVALGSALV
jgi:hypothetical protein